VLADPDWHSGVIGIVAGRLAEMYTVPVLLIALREERGGGQIGQGSGRSPAGLPLHEALRQCGEYLLDHGGHAAAAGFRIRPERIDAFRERFCAAAAQHKQASPLPGRVIDAEVPLSALTPGLVNDLDRLEPYGCGNRRPLFLAG